MTKKELSTQQLDDLATECFKNPSNVHGLDAGTVTQLQKFLRTRGLLQKSTQYSCISLINWDEARMQRMYSLAASGYVFRALDEYSNPTDLFDADSMKTRKAECVIIEKFLKAKFQYNPDLHVRSCLPEGSSPEEILKSVSVSTTNTKNHYQTAESASRASYDIIRSAEKTLKMTIGTLKGIPALQEKHDVLARQLRELQIAGARICREVGGKLNDDLKRLLNNAPPAESTHFFERYIHENYEKLREVTSAVYQVPTDMENTMWFHGAFPTLEDAEKYQRKIHKQLPYGGFIIGNGGPALIAPDLEQEDAIRRYGDNADVMNGILDRAEKDQKIISDITKKKARRGRKIMILEEVKKGLKSNDIKKDPTGVKDYIKNISQISDLSRDSVLTDEDNEDIMREVLEEQSVIRLLGVQEDGSFGATDIKVHIPDEYAAEATLEAGLNK